MKLDLLAKKILIVGDYGRGKTTLAQKLSRKLGIPYYSTDDFYWKRKFLEKQDKESSIKEINQKVYSQDNWIVEGATYYLVGGGFKTANLIIYLSFPNIFSQWWAIIRRHQKRENETFLNLIKLLRHALYKKYNWGYLKNEPKMLELLEPYEDKVVILRSFKEIDNFINT
ncbi:hypothetical protein A2316_01990 [Candidatus Falkowbacteria bacterium RIFOXYB2_FULL_38_15]|uniref:DNA topology modulation protein FlaR n=1 Tax=Candidatus Falkowbacteria bacterium RIFOXYA2_FULL_38_12 TaxID=1797993 RepID=A0A1F5S3R9_9BACT|nr:MAG: hypothetical protein A2257_00805 [Candidatus Falkowbacteria bacterium RIFOXYA2_FULL_38_12]OGF33266.1 MAG: hypothetical protein A2316_01990 [Candidatus Falkowbacteria bacterium RIFOXYB2_FULL_38_15]OGF42359.1 MAG: hypothetical protein A2555_00205 [Candidatus Falkowbacteria bacterium RIFOXYD2_FULL_39_16]